MEKPKTLKSKEKQKEISTLTTVMAEFDIETQVNKMVMRAFDSLMRSNKQAFDFIKESQHKFVTFEERLSKAETYYQNIESNINSKVELTENMNARLQQFSNEFWQAMKDHNNETIAITKRLDQIIVEKKTLENKMGQSEKNLKKLETGQLNLNDKVNHEVTKIYETIKETDSRVGLKFQQQKQELQQLSHAINQSRSLLESKSSLLTTLMQDLELYKNDRPEMLNQLQKLFEEIQQRAFKLEIAEVRGYVDSKIVEEAQRVKEMWMRVETMVKVEERDRKREEKKLGDVVHKNKLQAQTKLKEAETELSRRLQLLLQELQSQKQSTEQTLQSLSISISTLNSKYSKQVPQLFQQTSSLKLSLESLTKDTRATSNEVKELFSNIESINQLLESIISQNKQRKQEMSNLKSSTANQGNVEQQMNSLFEKVGLIIERIGKLEGEVVTKISQDIQKNHSQQQDDFKALNALIDALSHQLKQNSLQQQSSLTSLTKQLTSQLTKTTNYLQSQIASSQTASEQLIENKISSIQKQLNELDQIQNQIREFKNVFQKQLQENDKVNASVAQKMERVMAMFTKMKSDLSVKFEQLNGEMQRRAVEIKGNVSDLDAIKKYLSIASECINILLASGVFLTEKSRDPNKDSSLLSNQSLNTTINADNKAELPQSKPIKITSILQGWILESDQTQQKAKYRGETFNNVQRPKLLQLMLEYFVKQTEKVKGTILENGKDVFIRVLESGQDMFQQRKKATSKRKPSELPKLYM